MRRGGKGKALRQGSIDISAGDRSKHPSDSPKTENEGDNELNSGKKRTATIEKSDMVNTISMMEPARKMIKLEPHKPSDDSESGDHDSQVEADKVGSSQDASGDTEQESKEQSNESTSQFAGMSKESIEKRLNSLENPPNMTPETVTEKCLPLMNNLIDDPFGWVFRDAVDPEALGLPDYFEVVKKPMHFELVKKNLEDNKYPEMDAFQRDVRLVFENSILYNGETSEVGQLALNMMTAFAEKYEALVKNMLAASEINAL